MSKFLDYFFDAVAESFGRTRDPFSTPSTLQFEEDHPLHDDEVVKSIDFTDRVNR